MSIRAQPAPLKVHILYLDESGTQSTARYFVVAGLAVFERQTYFLSQALDQLQARVLPGQAEPAFFHAATLHAPPNRIPPPFSSLTDQERRALTNAIYQAIADSNAHIFAVAMEKAFLTGDPYERGFEEIVNRFDMMLARALRDQGEPQRGLVVIAESSYKENLERIARRIWAHGHRWGETHNMADIPYFAPAERTRLLQLADFVSNAVFAFYESENARAFNQIAPRIDQEDGRLHGLVHLARDRRSCYCPACVTRRASPHLAAEDRDT